MFSWARRTRRAAYAGLAMLAIGAGLVVGLPRLPRLSRAASENGTALLQAARQGRVEEVRRLVRQGADVNWRSGKTGLTPLIAAATGGHTDVATVLLEAGAEPNRPDHAGMTPLASAVLFNQPAVVRLLLARGADANARLGRGRPAPLMLASDPDVARALLAAGADPRARAPDGRTAADCAASRGCGELAELLRLAAAEPTAANATGRAEGPTARSRQTDLTARPEKPLATGSKKSHPVESHPLPPTGRIGEKGGQEL